MISHSLRRKCKDFGVPLISCRITKITFLNALLDLIASVNLQSIEVFKQFKLGELKKTSIILQLLNRSVKTPQGLLEDVIVDVKGCYFPIDFLILDMPIKDDFCHQPIILSRPFLTTTKANIDCKNGIINIKLKEKNIPLYVFRNTKFPIEDMDE